MPTSKQAKKRVRQSEKRRLHNRVMRSTLRTQIKKVLKAVEAGDKSAAQAAYSAAVPAIDRVAEKKMIHKNKAARHKSRLNARVRAMA